MNSIPDESTKVGTEGGFLFMKPKANSKKFNIHDPNQTVLFEAYLKGELLNYPI